MDQTISDLAGLRAKLQTLTRKDLLSLAEEAGVAPSTAQKIRLGHIENPAYQKVVALMAALKKRSKTAKPAAMKATA